MAKPGWGTLGHVPWQLEAVPHHCRYACELSALIVSLSIANHGLEIERRSIAMYTCVIHRIMSLVRSPYARVSRIHMA